MRSTPFGRNPIARTPSRRDVLCRAVAIEAFEPRRLMSAALDPTFGNSGVVHYDDASTGSYTTAASVVAPGGKIVSLAVLDASNSAVVLRRFNANGTPDTAFDGDGVALIDLGTGDASVRVTDLAVDAGGSIYVAGTYADPAANDTNVAFVAHVLSGGAADVSYGNGAFVPGLALLNPTGADAAAPRLALAGNALFVGYTLQGGAAQNSVAVTMLNSGGGLETAYGAGGTSVTPIVGDSGSLGGLFVRGANVVLAGSTQVAGAASAGNATGNSLFFARLDGDGALDAAVGTGGFALTPARDEGFLLTGVAGSASGYAIVGDDLAFDPSGTIATPVIFSFGSDFAPAAGFGDGGALTIGDHPGLAIGLENFGDNVAIGADGSIYAVGQLSTDPATFAYDLAVIHVTAAGRLDATFDGDGVFTRDVGAYDAASTVEIDAAGRAVVTAFDSNPGASILRFAGDSVATPANRAPTVTVVSVAPGTVTRGVAATFAAMFADPDAGDALQVSWAFDDGTVLPFAAASGTTSSVSHAFATGGAHVATFTVRDAAGLSAGGTVSVNVLTYTLVNGTLSLTAGAGNDTIELSKNPAGGFVLKENGVSSTVTGTVSGIVINGSGGNDLIRVSVGITAPATLIGADGNDTLRGGSGNDVLIGDAGNDVLIGRDGRDLVIGGVGNDYLIGNAGEDILVSGTTTLSGNLAALTAVQAEWTSGHAWLVRVANVTGLVPLAGRLNGNAFLLPSVTVFEDGSTDTLSGGNGDDIYFAQLWGNGADVIHDANVYPASVASLVLGD